MTKGNKYSLGVFISVLLLLANQAFIQYFLNEKKSDAKVINVAGKQRMLSQKINLLFYQVQSDATKKSALTKVVNEWSGVHIAFQNGSEELNIPATENESVRAAFLGLDTIVHYVNALLVQNTRVEPINFTQLNALQADFLFRMNEIVKMFEKESNDKLHFIMVMELVLMIFSIVIIVLEVILIYKPIAQELDYQIHTIEQSNEELRQLNESISEFSFVTAHHLNEPLRKIVMFSGVLKDEYGDKLDGDAKDSLRVITNSALQIRKHFQAVLELNSVEWNKEKATIDLNKALNEVLLDKAEELTRLGASITVGELTSVVFNRKEIKAIFEELIDNSLLFNSTCKNLKINIYLGKSAKGVKVIFEDNGVGISPEMSEKIFQLFQQVAPEKNSNGVGIGLSLVNKMMITHKGRIKLDKSFMAGARFVLEFA